MNKIKYIERLTNLFNCFANVYVHKECVQEILELTNRTGMESRFLKKLKEYLVRLKNDGPNAIGQNGLENLGGNDCANMYSMHFESSNYNLRIIFSITDDGTLLLHTFYEKSGKKVTEYSSHLPVAQKRLQQMTF
ncbi:hypothetical protein [Faecalispora anaeroviscerum]|uniref:hypothetical protein n=1 Tax=Faecalispora anaeroviscerum TaxID=2991836 RepID=UPI0024B93EC0|nr:hypothetical protein [Faecalispora anaeroviscerum]